MFIWAPQEDGSWSPGAASQWWLNRSLAALRADLEKRGSRLIIRTGSTQTTLVQLLAETGATGVFWNRRYEPASIARDGELKTKLRERGIVAESFNGSLLFEPWQIQNASGSPFRVFTAFWRACLTKTIAGHLPHPNTQLVPPTTWPTSLQLSDLKLEPEIAWAREFDSIWQPGEAGANKQLKSFQTRAMGDYQKGRDNPGVLGTSRLAPHLHFGEISPRQVWGALKNEPAHDAFLRQIGWREFAHHLLYHHPESPERPLRPAFEAFPWVTNPRHLKAWQQGRTGYPLVDAGMRELWHTGWMHNRVRMVAASFLVKHLLIDWQHGAAWFWDTLVDADLANNTLGWQWVAGCGSDAAPYFRIFNPVLQGEKFDPSGAYIRRWIPELAAVPDEWIHKPWSAPNAAFREADVDPGKTYPQPIVDHAEARERALTSLRTIKGS